MWCKYPRASKRCNFSPLTCLFKHPREQLFPLIWLDLWSSARRWKCQEIKGGEMCVCRKHPEFCQHCNYYLWRGNRRGRGLGMSQYFWRDTKMVDFFGSPCDPFQLDLAEWDPPPPLPPHPHHHTTTSPLPWDSPCTCAFPSFDASSSFGSVSDNGGRTQICQIWKFAPALVLRAAKVGIMQNGGSLPPPSIWSSLAIQIHKHKYTTTKNQIHPG